MNILTSRLQAEILAQPKAVGGRATEAGQKLSRGTFELHALQGNGSMTSQWDGDARRHPGQQTPRAMRAFLGVAAVDKDADSGAFSFRG